jgi:hypothetical protein
MEQVADFYIIWAILNVSLGRPLLPLLVSTGHRLRQLLRTSLSRIQWHRQPKMGNGRLLTSSTKGRGGRTGVLLPSPSDD